MSMIYRYAYTSCTRVTQVTQVWSKKNVPVPGNQTSCTFHPQAPDIKNLSLIKLSTIL